MKSLITIIRTTALGYANLKKAMHKEGLINFKESTRPVKKSVEVTFRFEGTSADLQRTMAVVQVVTSTQAGRVKRGIYSVMAFIAPNLPKNFIKDPYQIAAYLANS